jgi:hypothetical protein
MTFYVLEITANTRVASHRIRGVSSPNPEKLGLWSTLTLKVFLQMR